MAQEYNTQEYNQGQYNVDSMPALINLADSIVIIDSTVEKSVVTGIFSESLVLSDLLTKSVNSSVTEFLNMLEQITQKNVDIKGFADTLDMDLWLTIDRNDNNSKFTEQ